MTIRNLFPDELPSLSLNFAKVKALDPRVTFTRASGATHVDASGTWREVSNNVPRFDHNPTTKESLGLLIEEQRTNYIRNPRAEGAVAGTPGTIPTNWGIQTVTGVSTTVVGTGIEDGVQYVDINFSGTNSGSTGFPTVFFETNSGISASSSQVWAGSLYCKLVSGTLPTSLQAAVWEFGSGGTYLRTTNFSNGLITPTGASLGTQRRLVGALTTGASVVSIRPLIATTVNAGQTVDFTIRVGWPQTELGRFATSPILPPVSTLASSTRATDAASLSGTNFSSWYRQDEGTIFIDAQTNITYVNANLFPFRFHIDNGTTANTIVNLSRVLAAYTDQTYGVTVSSVAQAAYDTNLNNGNSKSAVAYKANDFAFAVQGAVRSTDTVGSVPTVNQMQLGSQRGSNILNGTIKMFSYYSYRVPNTDLQALTKL